MKKSLLALAVAGAVAVPYASQTQAAEVTVSGVVELHLYLSQQETEGNADGTTEENVKNGLNIDPDSARVQVSAVEDIGSNEGFANLRVDADQTSEQSIKHIDEVRVGLRGGFGQVTLGEDAEYAESGQLANDILLESAIKSNAALSYKTPSFGGVTIGVNTIFDVQESDSTADTAADTVFEAFGAGVKWEGDFGDSFGLTVGLGTLSGKYDYRTKETSGTKTKIETIDGDAGKGDYTYSSLGVKATFSPVYVALAYQQDDIGDDWETRSSLDFQVGVDVGAVSASLTASQGTGFRKIEGSNQDADDDTDAASDDDMKSQRYRIDGKYSLSDNFYLNTRIQTGSDSVDTSGAKDSSESFVRLGMGMTF